MNQHPRNSMGQCSSRSVFSAFISQSYIFLCAALTASSLIGGTGHSHSAGLIMTNEMGRKSGPFIMRLNKVTLQ